MAASMLCLVTTAAFLLAPLPGAFGKDSYFVSVPKEIIRGFPFVISVDILKGPFVEVAATLNHRVYNGTTLRTDLIELASVQGFFSEGYPRSLEIPIGYDFDCNGRCELHIQGRGSLVFDRKHSVYVKQDLVSVYIQTDKAIYKPQQQVRYRAFAVYPNLQVYKGNLGIEIMDPSGSRLVSKTGLNSTSGVVEGFLNLSDQPPFGDWTITAKLDGLRDSGSQTFTVDEYELPRFEVTVSIPSYGLMSETSLSGKVKAEYTFGKPVKGMVELHVGPDRGPDNCGKMPKTVTIAFKIDGEASFNIPKSSIQRVVPIIPGARVRVTAFVKEETTGVKLEGTNSLQYHSQEYSVSFTSNTPNVFKPGLLYTAYVQVKSPDGLPPPEHMRTTVVIYPHASYEVTAPNQTKYGVGVFTGTYPLPAVRNPIPVDGIVPFNFYIPQNATAISLKAHFESVSKSMNVQKSQSPSNNYLQLSLEGGNVKAGEKASFLLEGTEPIDNVKYEILARGLIVQVGRLNSNGKNTHRFDLEITSAMGPVANLITYYSRSNAEIVADSISFNVDGIFENEVSIDFNTEKTETDTNVQLKVTADPSSHVFILAVDESVLLLKSGNDIETGKVEKGISSQKRLDSEFAQSHSAPDVGSTFTKVGLTYITDLTMPTGFERSQIPMEFASVDYFDDSDLMHHTLLTARGAPKIDQPETSVKKIRKYFPEAWLWTDVSSSADGTLMINTTVPDTITSWVASAFATNDKTGLGVAPFKANLTVFRTFFVVLNYPRVVKRNEQAVVQATVFNYFPKDLMVSVTMDASQGYQHLVSVDGGKLFVEESGMKSQEILVPANSQGVVYFPIQTKTVGVFDVVVKAVSSAAMDGVQRQLTIEPEGAPVSYNVPVFLERNAKGKLFKKRIYFDFPPSKVSGSEKISVGVSGDLIGPSLSNLDSLLSIPMGCGEQNLVKMAPNVYMADYLRSQGQLTAATKEYINGLLELGYQRQLSYRRHDGSFSPFGRNDESGSTWLTAYVGRILAEAKKHVYVDESLVKRIGVWLENRQRDDGAFVEVGRVIDPNTQGAEDSPQLTAFVLITFLKIKDLFLDTPNCEDICALKANSKWLNITERAIAYLERSLATAEEAYPLSVMAYALTLANSTKAQEAFQRLRRKSTRTRGLIYWEGIKKTPAKTFFDSLRSPRIPSRPVNILATSYALLTYIAQGQWGRALPIVKWLTSQRNALGGFSSTQDTAVAIQALSAFANRNARNNLDFKVNFEYYDESFEFSVNKENALDVQRAEIDTVLSQKRRHNIDMKAEGSGMVVAEVNYDFHVNEASPTDAFDVNTVLLDDDLDSFNLMICTKWMQEGESGMVVQEIEIPSGFKPDFTSIGRVVGMKRYERKGNVVAVYFDEIVKTSTCYDLLMTRTAKVAKSEKMFVRTFSYYMPEDISIVFYHPRKLRDSSVCDVAPKYCVQ